MEIFSHKGKDVAFWQVTGNVLGTDKFSETHIASSGGGGFITRGVGIISSPKVHSSSVTNHEFWIKTEDGIEKDISLRGIDIPLRPGQKITLISAGRKDTDKNCYSILINHNAKKHWFIKSAGELNQELKLELCTGKSLLICGAIALVLGFATSEWEFAWAVAGTVLVYRIIRRLRKISRFEKKLQSHLENLALLTYET